MSDEAHGSDLQNLSKEELIQEVTRLAAHVKQLKNLLQKDSLISPKDDKSRQFDFSRYNVRHIALKILYAGWNYDGLVVQEDTQKTIEDFLFKALLKTRLIESRASSNYHRCGRTDKGVSAFSQVISITVRTNQSKGLGVITKKNISDEGKENYDVKEELNYVHMLNKVLPSDIRVVGWCPVNEGFSARFDCVGRTYKYIFPKADLDIEKLKTAGELLVGENDFRNFCKMDVGNGVINFRRKIISVSCLPLNSELLRKNDASENDSYEMYVLTIVGVAFLWHQIRCIVAILMMVAQGLEEVQVVEKLLDVENFPLKPQYTMASELPLVLYSCEYDGLHWNTDKEAMKETLLNLQALWSKQSIKSSMLRIMLSDLEKLADLHIPTQHRVLLPGNTPKIYKPLFDRPKCESLEDRILHHNRKRKQKYSLKRLLF